MLTRNCSLGFLRSEKELRSLLMYLMDSWMSFLLTFPLSFLLLLLSLGRNSLKKIWLHQHFLEQHQILSTKSLRFLEIYFINACPLILPIILKFETTSMITSVLYILLAMLKFMTFQISLTQTWFPMWLLFHLSDMYLLVWKLVLDAEDATVNKIVKSYVLIKLAFWWVW